MNYFSTEVNELIEELDEVIIKQVEEIIKKGIQ